MEQATSAPHTLPPLPPEVIEEEIRNLFKEKMQDIPRDKRDQWKADLEKNADAQQNLKERTQDLLNTMKEMESFFREAAATKIETQQHYFYRMGVIAWKEQSA